MIKYVIRFKNERYLLSREELEDFERKNGKQKILFWLKKID
jgi:hypothetical protein